MTALPAADGTRATGLPVLVVGFAAAVALGAPMWTLLLGPILFGVPHVIGDLRVLWLQRPMGLTASSACAVAAPVLLLTSVRVVGTAGYGSWPRLELASGVLAIAVGAVMGARSSRGRATAVLAGAALLATANANPALAVVFVAHAHNLVAVLGLALLAGPRSRAALLLFGIAFVLVACWPGGPETSFAAGLSWARCSQDLAPGLDAELADRFVRTFAFAQVVHYGLWTFVLPSQRGRSLREELGPFGLRAATVASVLVPLLALFDANATRSAYLTLAIGHGWFEFAIAAFALARRGGRS